MAKKVVLAGACRTAIGTMGGGLSTVPAALFMYLKIFMRRQTVRS